jgi:[methyl-Co(III) methanol-specific corrinoid protein]:coenzyme M methyltransferase
MTWKDDGTMTPRERFLAALRGEKPDRTPVANVAALTPVELQERTGCSMPEAHHDPAKLVSLCAANHEVLGFDGVSFIINYFNEPAALGTRIEWGSRVDLPMFASHPWAAPEDAVIPGDFLDREPIRTNLAAIRMAREQLPDVGVIGKVMGPLSMTQVLHGVENTMVGLIDAPGKIQRFLDICVGALVKCANAQFKEGADTLVIGEGGAGAKMLSPAMYERYLAEVHRRMISEIQGPTVLHMCGDITPRLGSLRQVGLTCFNFDWAIDPRAMKEAAGGKFSIMGNVNTTDLLRGAPATIEEQVRACLDAEVDIISPGCAVSPQCPIENFQAMTRATTTREAPRGDQGTTTSKHPKTPKSRAFDERIERTPFEK